MNTPLLYSIRSSFSSYHLHIIEKPFFGGAKLRIPLFRVKSFVYRLVLFLSFIGFGVEPVSAQALSEQGMEFIDPVSGDFRYSKELISIRHSTGQEHSIGMSYSAGIRIDQQASMVGLGWDLNLPEIKRQVNGVPDDYLNEDVVEVIKQNDGSQVEHTTEYVGAMYSDDNNFDAFNANGNANDWSKSMDVFTDPSSGSELLNFDDFFISSPGVSGRARFYFLEEVQLKQRTLFDDNGQWLKKYVHTDPQVSYSLANPTGAKLKMRLFSEYDRASYDDDSSSTSSEGKGSVGIEFYTNEQLQNSQGIYDPISSSRASLPDKGIGAFVITDTKGYRYVFSLPVYSFDYVGYEYEFSNTSASFPSQASDKRHYGKSQSGKYAVSWKLTAILGPNYTDANSDNKPNGNDNGYWVRYDYVQWSSAYQQRVPYTGFSESMRIKRPGGESENRVPALRGSSSKFKQGVYYVKKIETDIERLSFTYESRKDAIEAKVNSIGYKLRLKNIFKSRVTGPSLSTGFIPAPSGLSSYGSVNLYPSSVSSSFLNAQLERVEFSYNYSLHPGISDHVNGKLQSGLAKSYDFGSTGDFGSTTVYYDHPSTSPSNTGKLTLTALSFYGPGNDKVYPDITFSYYTSGNFAYQPYKRDWWGHYNTQRTGYFQSNWQPTTGTYIEEGSLKKITLPSGAEIKVNYQPDEFDKVYASDLKEVIWITGIPSSGSPNLLSVSASGLSSELNELDVFVEWDKKCLRDVELFNTLGSVPIETIKRKITARYYKTFDNGSDLVSNLNTANISPNNGYQDCSWAVSVDKTNDFEWGYILKNLSTAIGGGLRVESIEFIESDLNANSYLLEAEYEGALCTSIPRPFQVLGNRLYQKPNGSATLLGSVVAYEKVRFTPKNANNTAIALGSTEFIHLVRDFPWHVWQSKSLDTDLDRTVILPNFYFDAQITWQSLHDSINGGTYFGLPIPTLLKYILLDITGLQNLDLPILFTASGRIHWPCQWPVPSGFPLHPCHGGDCGNCITNSLSVQYSIARVAEVHWKNEVKALSDRSSFFGLLTEKRHLDNHGNMVSREYYDYESRTNARETFLTSVEYRKDPGGNNDVVSGSHRVNWNSQIPVLKRVRSSKNGLDKVTEYVSRNRFGQPTEIIEADESYGSIQRELKYVWEEWAPEDAFSPKAKGAGNGNWIDALRSEKVYFLKQKKEPFYFTVSTESKEQVSGIKNFYSTDQSQTVYVKNCSVGTYSSNDFPILSEVQRYKNGSWNTEKKVSLVNTKGVPLEVEFPLSDYHVAYVFNHDEGYLVSEVKNATYQSIGLVDFESYSTDCSSQYPTGLTTTGGLRIPFSNGAHSGTDVLQVGEGTSGSSAPSWQKDVVPGPRPLTNTNYVTSAWVWLNGSSDARITALVDNGSTVTTYTSQTLAVAQGNGAFVSNGWLLLELVFPVDPQTDVITVRLENPTLPRNETGNAYFDDFRVHPAGAEVVLNGINPSTKRVDYVLDNHNIRTRVEYTQSEHTSTVSSYLETSAGEKIIQKETTHIKQ